MELGIERIREAAPHLDEVGYRVDDLIVDVRRQRVARGNEEISLSPLSYELLLALLDAAPDLVSLDELMKRVWPDVVVSPETVSQRVKLVRNALGDDAGAPRYIAGVRGRGYRLIAGVKTMTPPDAPNPDGIAPPATSPTTHPVQPSETSASRSPLRKAVLLRRAVPALLGLPVAAALVYAVLLYDGLIQENNGESPRNRSAAPPSASVAGPVENSLAVLPFVNLSDDPDSEHFSDGLSEEILNRLSRAGGLRVLARTSSFAYKDSHLDVRKLRELLGVRYLLEGSVRREGRHLRVTAQLVDASGFRVWSESYDREMTGVFAIQDEIAASVATSILPQVAVVPNAEDLPNVEAYERYLIGREILRKRLQNSGVPAPRELDRAIEIDPDFAEARAELAIALSASAGVWKGADVLDRAEDEIDVALSIEPDLARAHAAQGFLLLSRHVVQMQPLDGPRIEAALRTALVLDPDMVDAHHWLASAYREQGRYDDARAEWERTARAAPLAPAVNANLAADLASQGDFAAAERRLKRLLEVPQPSAIAYRALADLYFMAGRLDLSNEIARQLAWTGVERGRVSNDLLVASYARLGLWDLAGYWQDRIERERSEAPDARIGRHELLSLQGRYAEAAAALETALEAERIDPAAAHLVFRLGTLRALAGRYADAIQALEPASVGEFTPADVGVDAGHGLAWAYLRSGTPERAQPILQALEEFFLALRAGNRLHRGGMLYLFAQNAVLAGERELAVVRLRQAVGAGWRDYYRLLHDPRWQSVRTDPRFTALLATVKADVDRQRAELEQDNRDFVARIDAAVGARRRLPD